jgi:hypothetical protein
MVSKAQRLAAVSTQKQLQLTLERDTDYDCEHGHHDCATEQNGACHGELCAIWMGRGERYS